MKLYIEAKDISRFLATVERHFKAIALQSPAGSSVPGGGGAGAGGSSLVTIEETIPGMLKALKHVWAISRHYNKDKRMGPLMLKIVNNFADQIQKKLTLFNLFKRQADGIREIQKAQGQS